MLTTDRVAGGALVLIGVVAVWESRRFPLGSLHRPGPAYMPTLLALLPVFAWRSRHGLAQSALQRGRLDEWRHAVGSSRRARSPRGGSTIGSVSPGLRAVFLLLVLERKGVILTAIFSVAVAWGSFFLFDTFLRVPLPRGPFGL